MAGKRSLAPDAGLPLSGSSIATASGSATKRCSPFSTSGAACGLRRSEAAGYAASRQWLSHRLGAANHRRGSRTCRPEPAAAGRLRRPARPQALGRDRSAASRLSRPCRAHRARRSGSAAALDPRACAGSPTSCKPKATGQPHPVGTLLHDLGFSLQPTPRHARRPASGPRRAVCLHQRARHAALRPASR